MHAMCADQNIYEFIGHLGIGHIASEPIGTALSNHFRYNNHWFGQLMLPVVQGLIGINHFATATLVGETNPLTDETFSLGTVNSIKLFGDFYKEEYDFDNLAPDVDLKNRGFYTDKDNFDFHYRDDALELFGIMKKRLSNLINLYYKSDGDVQKD